MRTNIRNRVQWYFGPRKGGFTFGVSLYGGTFRITGASEGTITIVVDPPQTHAGTYEVDLEDLAISPVILAGPSYTGTPEESETLTVVTPLIAYLASDGEPVLSWSWTRASVEVGTGTTYDVTSDDVAEGLDLNVTATNSAPSSGEGSVEIIAEPVVWHPSDLFGSGEDGAVYEIHPDNLRQLSDGTGTVTVGSRVGYIADLSGNGNHATQSNTDWRATLRQTGGGLYYLELDGSIQRFSFPTQTFTQCTFAHAVRQETTTPNLVWGYSGNANQKFGIVTSTRDFFFRTGTVAVDVDVASFSSAPAVLVGVQNATTISGRKDGASVGSASFTAASANWDLLFFAASGGMFDGDFYGGMMISRALTGGEIDELEAWLAAKSGVTL